MEIKFRAGFHKRYQKLNTKVKIAFHQRLKLFIQDSHQPILKNHPLSGKLQGYRAFSITGDVRVVFYISDGSAHLIDIGTHNQVYGK